MVELEDQVATNHQGDHPEGHPQVVRLVARLGMTVMIEMMIPWERDSHRMEVGYWMVDTELLLSRLTLDLGD